MNKNDLSKVDIFAITAAIACRLSDLSRNMSSGLNQQQFQQLAVANEHFRKLFPFDPV